MEINLKLQDEIYQIKVQKKKEKYLTTIEGKTTEIKVIKLNQGALFTFGAKNKKPVFCISQGKDIYLWIQGKTFKLQQIKRKEIKKEKIELSSQEKEGIISTPMPGNILKICTQEGQEVEKGETLIIMESMKMENNLKSPFKGIVKKIYVESGAQVGFGERLLEIVPA
jgi:biotin carboxyl carrier protein